MQAYFYLGSAAGVVLAIVGFAAAAVARGLPAADLTLGRWLYLGTASSCVTVCVVLAGGYFATLIVTFYEMVQSLLRIINVSFTVVGLTMLYLSTQALRRTVAIQHRVEAVDTEVYVGFIVASALFMFLSFIGIVATWFSMRPLALVHAGCALCMMVVVVVVSVRAGSLSDVIDGP